MLLNCVGELLQFVLGADLDAMAEIAVAEPPRAGAQRRDRNQHPPRQQGAGEDRDQKPEPDQQRDPQQLIADRRQRLRRRLFEQHDPAELRHRAGGGQHRIAVERRCPRPARRPSGADQRRDLRQLRQVLADLGPLRGARQHLAARIDHIGEGRLADLGVAEEIRQEAQVDLGDGDAGVEAGMRHRDRHEGLRAVEIGRRDS